MVKNIIFLIFILSFSYLSNLILSTKINSEGMTDLIGIP